MRPAAARVIASLGLQPHPEGGWYRETVRTPPLDPAGGRGDLSSILFLLEAGQRSHWHRIDAAELWIHQGGGPLLLETSDGQATLERRLGGDPLTGDALQILVRPYEWQAARALSDWSLVACVVAPGFLFERFELAPEHWSPGGGIESAGTPTVS